MKRSNLLAILAIALTCVAFAQVSMAATVTGTVVSKTTDTVVISTPNGQETFTVSGSGIYPAGMDVGSRVTVTYMPSTAGGRNSADSIVMAIGDTPAASMTGTSTTTSATTVTGTVVSKTADTIVISTPSGQRTFMVSAANLFPTNMDVGDRVSVSFTPATAGGRDRADRIMLASTTTSTTSTSSTSTSTTDYSSPRTSTTSTYDRDEDLPDTAGPVPVLAALGFAAVAAGLGLRAISRRRVHS